MQGVLRLVSAGAIALSAAALLWCEPVAAQAVDPCNASLAEMRRHARESQERVSRAPDLEAAFIFGLRRRAELVEKIDAAIAACGSGVWLGFRTLHEIREELIGQRDRKPNVPPELD